MNRKQPMKDRHITPRELQTTLKNFIRQYGDLALLTALRTYAASRQLYICKTKDSIKRIPIYLINYVEILGHTITIHTETENFTKYGTLKEEYLQLKELGFVRCNQSLLVPISKIAEIRKTTIILTTGEEFILSRSCAAKVIHAYLNQIPNNHQP